MRIWIGDGQAGLMVDGRRVDDRPCRALCSSGARVYGAFGEMGGCFEGNEKAFDFPLPPGTNTLLPFGGHVCALGSECDCVWALCPGDGGVRLTAPAGSYPRHACVSPCGRYLAVAGTGEVVMLDRALRCVCRHRVAGAAVDVCFLPRALAVLCAVGEEKITSRLLMISGRGVTEEVCVVPRLPCRLLALPGGRMLMGMHGQVLHLDARGKPVGRTPCVYPSRMRLTPRGAMFADGWQGGVYTLQGQQIAACAEPEDFLTV